MIAINNACYHVAVGLSHLGTMLATAPTLRDVLSYRARNVHRVPMMIIDITPGMAKSAGNWVRNHTEIRFFLADRAQELQQFRLDVPFDEHLASSDKRHFLTHTSLKNTIRYLATMQDPRRRCTEPALQNSSYSQQELTCA